MGAENLTVLVRYLCAIGAPFLWLCAKRGNKPQQARVPQSTHYSHLWVFVKICKKLKSHLRLWRLWVQFPSGRPRIIAVCEHSQAAIIFCKAEIVRHLCAIHIFLRENNSQIRMNLRAVFMLFWVWHWQYIPMNACQLPWWCGCKYRWWYLSCCVRVCLICLRCLHRWNTAQKP